MVGDIFPGLFGLFLISIPWVLVAGAVIWLLPRTALGRGLMGRSERATEQAERIAYLEEEVAQLRSTVAELSERQDFADRVISGKRENG
jgi:hypothetical protein